MKNYFAIGILFFASAYFTACNNLNSNEATNSSETEQEQPALSIKPFNNSPEFPNAKLTLSHVSAAPAEHPDSVKLLFTYEVSNYELKAQTTDATAKGCNNSKDGQHIHFILDQKPYTALYEPKHSVVVAKNSEHYITSFLSRSYHESLKNDEAGLVLHLKIDAEGKLHQLEPAATPMIFYSRPKGDYLGDDTKLVLLDFYLKNVTLSPNGHKVVAHINGQTFTIDTWQPYFIENAPMGDLNVELKLVDEKGNDLSGVNTHVGQTVKLALQEPIQ